MSNNLETHNNETTPVHVTGNRLNGHLLIGGWLPLPACETLAVVVEGTCARCVAGCMRHVEADDAYAGEALTHLLALTAIPAELDPTDAYRIMVLRKRVQDGQSTGYGHAAAILARTARDRRALELAALVSECEVYRVEAEKALDKGDLDTHMQYGALYHDAAERYLRLCGVEIRPSAEIV